MPLSPCASRWMHFFCRIFTVQSSRTGALPPQHLRHCMHHLWLRHRPAVVCPVIVSTAASLGTSAAPLRASGTGGSTPAQTLAASVWGQRPGDARAVAMIPQPASSMYSVRQRTSAALRSQHRTFAAPEDGHAMCMQSVRPANVWLLLTEVSSHSRRNSQRICDATCGAAPASAQSGATHMRLAECPWLVTGDKRVNKPDRPRFQWITIQHAATCQNIPQTHGQSAAVSAGQPKLCSAEPPQHPRHGAHADRGAAPAATVATTHGARRSPAPPGGRQAAAPAAAGAAGRRPRRADALHNIPLQLRAHEHHAVAVLRHLDQATDVVKPLAHGGERGEACMTGARLADDSRRQADLPSTSSAAPPGSRAVARRRPAACHPHVLNQSCIHG